MYAKLLLIIGVLGATACGLVVIRQQRIETAHETAALHQELVEQRQALWQLRCEVAGSCRPQRLELAVSRLGGSWAPVVIEPPDRDTPLLQLASREP
jgi:hypothetical protein